MTRRLHSEEGLSLPEVLLAATLMLVVLGATLTSLNSFQSNAKTNELQNEAQDQVRNAMGRLARDLRNLASPTVNLPLAVDRAGPQDVIFQSEGKDKPTGSLNAQNTTRVRYCLDAEEGDLYRQIQEWTTAVAPGIPAGTECPSAGWTSTHLVASDVVNGSRPVFTYNAAELDAITEISTQLFVDVNPNRAPDEVELQTSVFLRNQNRAPTATFDWASMPGGNVFLNASGSIDPEEKALTFEWWDMALDSKVGEGIVFTYKPPEAGWRDIKLIVKDQALEAEFTDDVCSSGTGVVCP